MKFLLICVQLLIIFKLTTSKCYNRQCNDLCNYDCDDNDTDCGYEETECCESCNNPCVQTCSTRCRTRTCRNNCLTICQKRPCSMKNNNIRKNCKENCPEDRCPIEPIPEPLSSTPQPPSSNNNDERVIMIDSPPQNPIIPNITTNNFVNLTTHINLNNVVHNINNITTPIFVNTTNINHIAIVNNGSSSSRGYPTRIENQPSPPIFININTTNTNRDTILINGTDNKLPCCKIMGPKQCYFDENGKPKCRQHRYTVCGPMCYSPVIIQTENRYPLPIGCQQNNPSYTSCSPTIINQPPPPPPPVNLPIGCYPCYSCGGGNNPNQCWQSPNCPYICRQLLQQSNCASNQQGIPCQ